LIIGWPLKITLSANLTGMRNRMFSDGWARSAGVMQAALPVPALTLNLALRKQRLENPSPT